MDRMTAAEQAGFIPPSCPRCGGNDIEVHWQDATYSVDDERHYTPALLECRTCVCDHALTLDVTTYNDSGATVTTCRCGARTMRSA